MLTRFYKVKIIKVDIELHPLGGKQAWNLKTLVHIPTEVDIALFNLKV